MMGKKQTPRDLQRKANKQFSKRERLGHNMSKLLYYVAVESTFPLQRLPFTHDEQLLIRDVYYNAIKGAPIQSLDKSLIDRVRKYNRTFIKGKSKGNSERKSRRSYLDAFDRLIGELCVYN